MNKLGALWINKNKQDEEYFKGEIKIGDVTTPVIIFKNGFKKADKQPDYHIYLSEKKENVPF